MPTIIARIVPVLAFASACTAPANSAEPSEPSAAPQVIAEPAIREPAPTQSSEAPGPLEIALGEQLVQPTAFAPSRELGMTIEPRQLGWSADSGEFVLCVPSGGAVCAWCDFHSRDGRRERMGVGEDCRAERVTQAQLDARLANGRFALGKGDWAYGAELVLVVAKRQGDPDVTGTPRGVVEIGVRARDSDRVVWLEQIEHCFDGYCAPDVHIDAIAPSPDGRTIAVLAHTFAGEFSDTYPLRLLDAVALMSRVRGE